MRARLVIIVAAAVAGCAHAGDDDRRGAGRVVVSASPGGVRAVYAVADRLVRPGDVTRLAAPVTPTLIGTLSPALVPDPRDPRRLAYNSWHGSRPTLRVRDARSGRDRLLAEGALSLAWRRDGTVAYFRALQPDLRDPKRYLGHVVVRDWRARRDERWTAKAGRYVVAAWARERLLVYRLRAGWPDLLVLDGRGRSRLLARAGALVAVSADGRLAFLARYGASPPLVRVVDVASGRERVRLRLRRLAWVLESGSWAGDRVAAGTSAGIALFEVRSNQLELEQILRLPRAEFAVGPFEPRLSASGGRVAAWFQLPERPREAIPAAVVVECDLSVRRCRRSAEVPSDPGPRLVYNPSRP